LNLIESLLEPNIFFQLLLSRKDEPLVFLDLEL
jgi:hypothetical protein